MSEQKLAEVLQEMQQDLMKLHQRMENLAKYNLKKAHEIPQLKRGMDASTPDTSVEVPDGAIQNLTMGVEGGNPRDGSDK